MDGCCDNETLHFEVEDDFLGSSSATLNNSIEIQILFPIYFLSNQISFDTESKTASAFYGSLHPPGTQTRLAQLQRYLC